MVSCGRGRVGLWGFREVHRGDCQFLGLAHAHVRVLRTHTPALYNALSVKVVVLFRGSSNCIQQ